MLSRPVEPQPVKKIRPPRLSVAKTSAAMGSSTPAAARLRYFATTSASASNKRSREAAMSAPATSLNLAVTGWELSVTKAPNLNWPLIFRNWADFCRE